MYLQDCMAMMSLNDQCMLSMTLKQDCEHLLFSIRERKTAKELADDMAKRMSLLLSNTDKQRSDNCCVLYYFPDDLSMQSLKFRVILASHM